MLDHNMITALLSLFLLPSIASALNGNGRHAFVTYDGWKAFELVTQGDKLDGFEMPGNMDGIGVSFEVQVPFLELILCD